MDQLLFKNFIKKDEMKDIIYIKNVFSNYISCIFSKNNIVYHEDLKKLDILNWSVDGYCGVHTIVYLKLNKYENNILLFDTDYILLFDIKDKSIFSEFRLWGYILPRMVRTDTLFSGCEKKCLQYKIKNNILKI